MTYHRTAGKGGTRNSVRERHADRFLPNFNKRQGSGANPRGRRKDNPPSPERDFKAAAKSRQRFNDMMFKAKHAGIKPKRSVMDRIIEPSPFD